MSDEKFTDEEIRVIGKLLGEGRVFATIDEDGKPFHRVLTISTHSLFPDKVILWLEPQGLDDDLETPMDC